MTRREYDEKWIDDSDWFHDRPWLVLIVIAPLWIFMVTLGAWIVGMKELWRGVSDDCTESVRRFKDWRSIEPAEPTHE